MPSSLHFTSWRELRRVRWSVIAIIVACLVGVVIPAALSVFIVFGGMFGPRAVWKSAWAIWTWGGIAANFALLVAIIAAAWPGQRLPAYAVVCGWIAVAVGIAGALLLVGAEAAGPFVKPKTAAPGTLMGAGLAATHGIALVLVWPCLATRLKDRATRVLLSAAGLTACVLVAPYVYAAIRGLVTLSSATPAWKLPMYSTLILLPNNREHGYDSVAAACWIVLLIAAWRFIRTLDRSCEEMQSQAPAASETLSAL